MNSGGDTETTDSLVLASSIPLAYIEVIPLLDYNNYYYKHDFVTVVNPADDVVVVTEEGEETQAQRSCCPSLLASSIKLFLWKMTLRETLVDNNNNNDDNNDNKNRNHPSSSSSSSSSLQYHQLQLHMQWEEDKDKGGDNNDLDLNQRNSNPSQLVCGNLYSVVVNNNNKINTQIKLDNDDNDITSTSSNEVHINNNSQSSKSKAKTERILYLPQNDPNLPALWPCLCRGYAFVRQRRQQQQKQQGSAMSMMERSCQATVTEATMIRVMAPSLSISSLGRSSLRKKLSQHLEMEYHLLRQTGECQESRLSEALEMEVLTNHNPQDIRALELRMRMLLADPNPITIGTTQDALSLRHLARQRKLLIRQAIHLHRKRTKSTITTKEAAAKKNANGSNAVSRSNNDNNNDIAATAARDGALLVHSPDHGAGKTLLVQTLAYRNLGCRRVHIVRPGHLWAKYGIHADAALETILHEAVLSAAMEQQLTTTLSFEENSSSLCIILDQVDTLLPPNICGTNGAGDAAVPVLNAMAAYVKSLMGHIKQRREFPFPSKNPLYNINGRGGFVLPVRLCLVGIVTCPDDGWQTGRSGNAASTTTSLLDCMGGRFRLPTLTSKTRQEAFRKALERQGVTMAPDLKEKLPYIAASAVWARGAAFSSVASLVRSTVASTDERDRQASAQDLAHALQAVNKVSTSHASDVQFTESDDPNSPNNQMFSSIGGNASAKVALGEALALDPGRRQLLDTFGLSPPTGILVYGPPGTGKTLLAKAVAKILRRGGNNSSSEPPSSAFGGAFISLRISDIVRAEIGTGEKLVASAFETARLNAPSVIFIDEFQALFTERGSGGSGRLSTTLLSCMDDCLRWSNVSQRAAKQLKDPNAEIQNSQRVVVLAATNTPWMVDKAFLRPGRFDRVVHVGLPNLEERQSILTLHIARMKTTFDNDTDKTIEIAKSLAAATDGFSGADLAALCRCAAVKCLQRNRHLVQEDDIQEALQQVTGPSSDDALVEKIAKWRP